MRNAGPSAVSTVHGAAEPASKGPVSPDPTPAGQDARARDRAAMGPIVEPVSAAANVLPAPTADSPAAAQGRRTLSTAFVRVGPDGQLTVKLRNGQVLTLRDVVMRPKDYCGVQLRDGARVKYCGGYAEVTAAWTGAAPAPEQPDLAAPNPIEAPRGSTRAK